MKYMSKISESKSLLFTTLLLLLVFAPFFVSAEIEPTSITATLSPGESVTEHKIVTIPAMIPNADIIFAFDLTGSMLDEIEVVKTQAIEIMNTLDTLITNANYGVVSFMDYPNVYGYDEENCGYLAEYGDGGEDCGDYAYQLNQDITSDKTAVANAIENLVIGCGSDGPQNYTRIFYESYADTNIHYRTGSKKIVILFGDNVPHDCNLNEGVPGKEDELVWTTGGDPGCDEIMNTGDDLDLQTVLSSMATNKVTLLAVLGSGYDALDYWKYWAGITGGDAYPLESANEIPEAIEALIEAEVKYIDKLLLEVSTPGYNSWLTSLIPPEYTSITAPATLEFDMTITVPGTTFGGTYNFIVSAIGDGASYGDQQVTVKVPVTLTIVKTGTGRGKVISSPAGINCGSDCSEAYATGTRVVMHIKPAEGSRVSNVKVNGVSIGTVKTVTFRSMKKNYTVEVNFTK